ncbi:MAG: pilus assembly protein PilZ [Pseudomonadales bacterium]|nr:pilus assembly protein PilZ [Pseudomonadales bacterium]
MNSPRGGGILQQVIQDKAVLYAAYMPFVKGGGLFVPTNRQYRLGEEVFMLLTLMDASNKFPIAGKVVWLSPSGPGIRAAGVGIQFVGGEAEMAKQRIEALLTGMLGSDKVTNTM